MCYFKSFRDAVRYMVLFIIFLFMGLKVIVTGLISRPMIRINITYFFLLGCPFITNQCLYKNCLERAEYTHLTSQHNNLRTLLLSKR